jgi:ADP-ribose pyrophosphatase
LSTTRKPLYRGTVVDLGVETVSLPNGHIISLEVIRHPGGSAIVALDGEKNVCLLKQYRHAAGGWLWELPAGKLEPGESARLTAHRELAEEAGLEGKHWQSLGTFLTTPGFCDERIHLFLAQHLNRVQEQPEIHEVIEIHWIPFQTALQQVYTGQIHDAKTMLGLLLAAPHVDGKPVA